ncbi:lipoate--protein ligase family protein [Halegenticoccus tardaugens]|uniref:lipoate--protein ligase family protein n=1 Tax=Halegenticoccus tardaugens TaxID=2071624 RepID=UPI00100ACBE8|nr:lipoate--protein ligase family protein [Halegenticoccus tardaugens]
MRVIRGRAASREADRDVTAEMLRRTAETGTPAIRAWTPHRQVAFGRRDAHAAGYDRARRAAEERGFPPVERSVGGRAVAYTGETTLAFALAVPVEDLRVGLDERYEDATETVLRALRGLGADVEGGEPPASFCPGRHSLRADTGGKIVGIAQRVTQGAALVSGCVLVDEREELVDVLVAVYGALDVPFDPDSVGSVAAAGGPSDPEAVARAIEEGFADGRETTVEHVE